MVDDVVTIGYAARALGLTDAAIYLAIKEKRVESRKVLNRLTIPRTELNRLKRQRKSKKARKSNGNGK